MTALAIVRGLCEYHAALNARVWDSIMTLSDAQFVEDLPYSQGSLRNHAVHLAVIDTRWTRGLQGDAEARHYDLDAATYPTREAARDLCAGVAAAVLAYVGGLSEADLLAAAPGMNEPRWQVLTHVVNHGTDHRSQMLRILGELGAPTFPQDLIFHWWSAGGARPR